MGASNRILSALSVTASALICLGIGRLGQGRCMLGLSSSRRRVRTGDELAEHPAVIGRPIGRLA